MLELRVLGTVIRLDLFGERKISRARVDPDWASQRRVGDVDGYRSTETAAVKIDETIEMAGRLQALALDRHLARAGGVGLDSADPDAVAIYPRYADLPVGPRVADRGHADAQGREPSLKRTCGRQGRGCRARGLSRAGRRVNVDGHAAGGERGQVRLVAHPLIHRVCHVDFRGVLHHRLDRLAVLPQEHREHYVDHVVNVVQAARARPWLH
mmetsp:Transcript_19802/g.56185  ORF Transcript_19802/g.56185 Transcript_19802/m.56185 type:complete len:211 (+) Transcript_19802:277-909(+)